MSAMKPKAKATTKPLHAMDAVAAQQPALFETMNQLKERLLKEHLIQVADPELSRYLKLAANESTALAWNTAYPLLVLPELMAERGRFTEIRHSRQTGIRERTRSKLSIAA